MAESCSYSKYCDERIVVLAHMLLDEGMLFYAGSGLVRTAHS